MLIPVSYGSSLMKSWKAIESEGIPVFEEDCESLLINYESDPELHDFKSCRLVHAFEFTGTVKIQFYFFVGTNFFSHYDF